jgi:hypothetical protein
MGAKATILPAITGGQYVMVGAGAVVTHAVPPYAVVVGSPARIQRYVATAPSVSQLAPERTPPVLPAQVMGVELIRIPMIKDLRGFRSAASMNPYIESSLLTKAVSTCGKHSSDYNCSRSPDRSSP